VRPIEMTGHAFGERGWIAEAVVSPPPLPRLCALHGWGSRLGSAGGQRIGSCAPGGVSV
jgi:hypothetical protein